MKKVLMLLLLVCIVLPVAAHAGSQEDVDGYFTYVPLGCEVEMWAGDNYILRGCTDVGDYFLGDFLGTSTEVYDFVMHGASAPYVYEKGFYKGTVTFTGTVKEERTGTMEILFVGKSPGDVMVWSGTWRIISGTGELANIHGNGVWGSSELGVHYQGKIHFEPE
jgi:hypothetical protein